MKLMYDGFLLTRDLAGERDKFSEKLVDMGEQQ